MSQALVEQETKMARRDVVTLKVDRDMARMINLVSGFEGISAAEYLSRRFSAQVEADYKAHLERSLKELGAGEGPKPHKPGSKK